MFCDGTRWAGLAVSLALMVTACTSSSPTVSDASDDVGTVPATSINVMQFNIEYGGEGVNFDSVAKAIVAADADVVAIQEGYGKIPAIAADLGWAYYDTRTQTVSKYPLVTPEAAEGGLVYVEVDGGVVGLFNLHLPSSGYGPNKAETGSTADEILARENRGRLRALEPALAAATSLVAQDIPTFVLGDFNAPSHRDWTDETVGLRDQIRFPLQWPTSLAAEAAGLVDVFRMLHPDPVEEQGLTWPASRPFVEGYNPGPHGAPADRIDLMYVGGPAEPTSVSIVGEKSSGFTDIAVSPWPSDHRAVVATVDLVPGSPASLVSVDQRLVEIGQDVSVRYYAQSDDAAALVVRPDGTSDQSVMEQSLDDSASGSTVLPSDGLEPGAYELVLLADDDSEVARSMFWVAALESRPEVSTGSREYTVGEPIDVSWNLAPGNKWDWLGIYKQGADPNVAYYKLWVYTDATIAGFTTFNSEVGVGAWPLPAGDYSVYLLADDSYQKLAESDFVITK